jgi:predicted RNA polymerase sigma factor
MAIAKRRAIDLFRRRERLERKHEAIGAGIAAAQAETPGLGAALDDDDIGDDLLRLMFVACHPVLSMEARVALTLRLLGGLETEEIARAFLVPVATMAQRIVRAKRTLAEARIPFEVPHGAERSARVDAVLEAIYLIYNEGYSATSGDQWVRPTLCGDALRLGRVLARLVPDEPEVLGLVALMEIQSSRLRARVGADGTPIRLLEQNRGRWDQLLIARGFAALERIDRLGVQLGPYALQAEIAACHARARVAENTDWGRIAALYDALAQIAPSPVVALNRAVALAMAFGPQAGLDAVDEIRDEPSLRTYHLLPNVRGEFLERLGRHAEAGAEFEHAARLTRNERERSGLLARAGACAEAAATSARPRY